MPGSDKLRISAKAIKKEFFSLLIYECQALIDDFLIKGIRTQRLELLGDKALSLILTEYVMETLPHFNEGELTKRISYLTSQTVLKDIIISNVPLPQILDWNVKRYADLLETLIGFAYQMKSKAWVIKYVHLRWRDYIHLYEVITFNPKGDLQETLAKLQTLPKYVIYGKTTNNEGAAYFYVKLSFNIRSRRHFFLGEGYSVRKAEEMSAKEALHFLQSYNLLSD